MRVFILEDDQTRMQTLRARLLNHEVTHIASCRDHAKFAPPYDLILLDHDLGGRQYTKHEDCGTTFCQLIKGRINRHLPQTVVIHSYNHVGAKRMQQELGFGIYAPFGGIEFDAILRGVLKAPSVPASVDDLLAREKRLLAKEPEHCPCGYCSRLRARIDALEEVEEVRASRRA